MPDKNKTQNYFLGGILDGFFDSGGTESQTQISFPPHVDQKLRNAMNMVMQAGQTEFMPYTDQRFAEFDPYEVTAQQETESLFNQYKPYMDTGLQAINAMQQWGLGGPDMNLVAGYLNPFIKDVIESQRAMAQKDLAGQRSQVISDQARLNQFGGSPRSGFELAKTYDDYRLGQGALESQMLKAGFDDSLTRAAQGLSRAADPTSLAGMLGADLTRTGALNLMGQQRRGLEQLGLDFAFDEWNLENRVWPFMTAGFTADHIGRLGNLYRAGSSETSNQSNPLTGLLGLGSTIFGGIFNEGGTVGYADGGLAQLYASAFNPSPLNPAPVSFVSNFMEDGGDTPLEAITDMVAERLDEEEEEDQDDFVLKGQPTNADLQDALVDMLGEGIYQEGVEYPLGKDPSQVPTLASYPLGTPLQNEGGIAGVDGYFRGGMANRRGPREQRGWLRSPGNLWSRNRLRHPAERFGPRPGGPMENPRTGGLYQMLINEGIARRPPPMMGGLADRPSARMPLPGPPRPIDPGWNMPTDPNMGAGLGGIRAGSLPLPYDPSGEGFFRPTKQLINEGGVAGYLMGGAVANGDPNQISGGGGLNALIGGAGEDRLAGGMGIAQGEWDWYHEGYDSVEDWMEGKPPPKPKGLLELLIDLFSDEDDDDDDENVRASIAKYFPWAVQNTSNLLDGASFTTRSGDTGDNILIAGAGDDTLGGGAGADILDGASFTTRSGDTITLPTPRTQTEGNLSFTSAPKMNPVDVFKIMGGAAPHVPTFNPLTGEAWNAEGEPIMKRNSGGELTSPRAFVFPWNNDEYQDPTILNPNRFTGADLGELNAPTRAEHGLPRSTVGDDPILKRTQDWPHVSELNEEAQKAILKAYTTMQDPKATQAERDAAKAFVKTVETAEGAGEKVKSFLSEIDSYFTEESDQRDKRLKAKNAPIPGKKPERTFTKDQLIQDLQNRTFGPTDPMKNALEQRLTARQTQKDLKDKTLTAGDLSTVRPNWENTWDTMRSRASQSVGEMYGTGKQKSAKKEGKNREAWINTGAALAQMAAKGMGAGLAIPQAAKTYQDTVLAQEERAFKKQQALHKAQMDEVTKMTNVGNMQANLNQVNTALEMLPYSIELEQAKTGYYQMKAKAEEAAARGDFTMFKMLEKMTDPTLSQIEAEKIMRENPGMSIVQAKGIHYAREMTALMQSPIYQQMMLSGTMGEAQGLPESGSGVAKFMRYTS